jgi:hypothetical protein
MEAMVSLMKYRFTDGKELEADNPEEFVRKMRATSFAPSQDEYEFMHDCAERGRRMGIYLKTENAERFLDSLIYYGIVSMVGLTNVFDNN